MNNSTNDREGARALSFTPLCHASTFIANAEYDEPGVYLLGFALGSTADGSQFLPYYVGRRFDSVRSRIRAHILDIPDGKGLIFDTEYITREFRGKPLPLGAFDRQAAAASPGTDRGPILWTCKDQGRKATARKSAPEEVCRRLEPHLEFYQRNMHATSIPVPRADWPDKVERRRLVASLEWFVKHELVGNDWALGRVGKPSDYSEPSYEIRAPKELSAAFANGCSRDRVRFV